MEKNSRTINIGVTFFRVQEFDGSYFESFTALAWKQENQRQSVLKAAEASASDPPSQEADLGIVPIDYTAPQNEKDKLYVEMLYTIANTVSFFDYFGRANVVFEIKEESVSLTKHTVFIECYHQTIWVLPRK